MKIKKKTLNVEKSQLTSKDARSGIERVSQRQTTICIENLILIEITQFTSESNTQ